MAVRTWAPRGQTLVLRVKVTRDHLSSISGITPDGRLFLQVRAASSDAAGVVGFLRVLMRKIAGKIVVIWDGAPIHCGQEIKDFLKRGAAKRLHLEHLPGYAPDLNPDEGIWNDPQARGVRQCLLCRSPAVAARTHPSKRALATQKRDQ